MQLNTARKWADRMEATPWHLDTAQLRFEVAGITYGSPYGVLADFLDPQGWALAWDGVSWLWHGEQFKLPASALPRGKMRRDGLLLEGDAPDLHGPPLQPHWQPRCWSGAAEWVRQNYQYL